MTQSCLSYSVLLFGSLLLLANCHGPDKTPQELQCNRSNTIEDEYSCGINTTILVKLCSSNNNKYPYHAYIQFNCYSTTPLRISLPLNMNLTKDVDTVEFNSCQFSVDDDILKILTISLQLSDVRKIAFDNEQIDSSLSRAHFKPLKGIVEELSFKIQNLSTLPIDLLEDLETLETLWIFSNFINSTHLSFILAPLENLKELVLKTNNQLEISERTVANNTNLHSLSLSNITILPPGFLSHLSNLVNIDWNGNYFESLPKDLLQTNRNLKEFSLTKNRVTLKRLPDGFFRDLPFLQKVIIIGCGLESIDSDIFTGSADLAAISFKENKLHELPLRLFVDQKTLRYLDLSRNMLKTLPEGLFDFTKSLENLLLSQNQLRNLSINIFKPLAHLLRLDLEYNNLFTISSDVNHPQLGSMFDNLKSLQMLFLRNNSITEIPYKIIEEIPLLVVLDLSFNKITSVNCTFVTYFDSKIYISGNPIHCDGTIICIQQYITQKPIEEHYRLSVIRCESPIDLKDRLLYDLRPIDLLSFADIAQVNFSKRCSYNIRVNDAVLVMNCSDVNLNDIPMLPILEQSFSKGLELYMDKNPLTKLSNRILKDNPNVTLFSLFDSNITQIPEGFLSNMSNLKTVSLVLPLNTVPKDTFFNSTAIEKLTISGTNMMYLPELIFANQSKVTDLDLSRNKLEGITDNPFVSNVNLQAIRLSHNSLKIFRWVGCSKLTMLKTLFLDNNSLSFAAWSLPPSLEFLNIESNKLGFMISPELQSLKTLILRNNLFVNVDNLDLGKIQSAYVDLSLNNFSSIDLLSPNFFKLKGCFWNFTDNDIQSIKVPYGNISLDCSCNTKSFVVDNNQNERSIYESLKCLPPYNHKDHHVSNLPVEELLCPTTIKLICPEKCQCWFRTGKSRLIVNCSNKSLTEVPLLPKLEPMFKDGIELSLEHNELRSLKPNPSSGFEGVIKIFAAHNEITNISIEDIPENLIELDLSYNKLERLDKEVITMIGKSRTLTTVKLYQNPFKCDCRSENLLQIDFVNKTISPDVYQCMEDQKFRKLSYSAACFIESSTIDKVIGEIPLAILGALFLLTVLYFKNKDRILIWMYAHNICLFWVTEEELDREKQFDAFISYSSWDMDFVGINLIPKLESGPKPYKLCLHDRDWLAGGYIPHQIEQSVECSRRTIIVMTQNYIKSQWTRFEFRTAHNASMNEKRPRVIVIMLDDNIQLEELDSDLRKYIKMYTYIRWNDPWFWDKLRYALPHPSKRNQKIKKYQMSVIQNGNAGDDGRTGSLTDQN